MTATAAIIPTDPIQKAVNRNDEHEAKATAIISKYTLMTSGATLIPYDLADIVTSTVTQSLMIRELCQLYNVPYSDKMANIALWSATGSLVSKAISAVVASVIGKTNVIKGIDITSAAISGIYTATMGEFYKIHFRDGGTLNDISIKDFGQYFLEEIERGNLSLDTFTNPKSLLQYLNIDLN